MTNVAKALLQTEGKTEYRGCQVAYYTYTLFEHPNSYKIGVNVHIQSEQSDWTKTLVIDQEFDTESAAINFGIEQAKKKIDNYYLMGKIPAAKPNTSKK